ncbi:Uncharacterised protein [Sphingobacterium multivorum]|uniref:Uncharacterized protein n=1 Tax=Sphingobacterium multivorum TaxID=28454 RepID=A0A2X2L8N1_SPHMU|nr:Uncharacterised protein [Sphingobacterium multivorum]
MHLNPTISTFNHVVLHTLFGKVKKSTLINFDQILRNEKLYKVITAFNGYDDYFINSIHGTKERCKCLGPYLLR